MVRRPLLPVLVLVASATLALAAEPSASAADGGAPPPAIPACVSVKSDSRYVPYGYNHVVTIANGCARETRCLVSTDVNPEQRAVDVPSNESREVVTFMGSPSATFVAKVSCKLK